MSKSYDTEIISVGTELLLGHVTNTDARDISEMLSKIGINVKYHTVVGDNPERLRKCVETAKSRADIIITTGGLGLPVTTSQSRSLPRLSASSSPRTRPSARGCTTISATARSSPDNISLRQCSRRAARCSHNNCGTAPGCGFEKDGKIVVMIPGPPKECNAMFRESALPYLRKLSEELIVSHSVRIFRSKAPSTIFCREMNPHDEPHHGCPTPRSATACSR